MIFQISSVSDFLGELAVNFPGCMIWMMIKSSKTRLDIFNMMQHNEKYDSATEILWLNIIEHNLV